jgi:hypothetical protein
MWTITDNSPCIGSPPISLEMKEIAQRAGEDDLCPTQGGSARINFEGGPPCLGQPQNAEVAACSLDQGGGIATLAFVADRMAANPKIYCCVGP